MSYTVGDIVAEMKNVVEKHLINQKDREVLRALDETSWTQLGVGAMLATVRGRKGEIRG